MIWNITDTTTGTTTTFDPAAQGLPELAEALGLDMTIESVNDAMIELQTELDNDEVQDDTLSFLGLAAELKSVEFDLESAAEELAEKRAKVKAAKARLAKRIKPDEDRIKELEHEISRAAQVGDNVAGDWHVRVTPSKTLMKDKLAEAYPQTQYPNLWKSEILGQKVQDFVGKDEYDKYRIENGKATVTVTDLSDD